MVNIFWEVKFDKMSESTGNLAVEVFNPKSDKPSGIMATMSDFWVFCFGNPIQIWVSEVDALKSYINDNKPFRVIDVGGDNNASLYLYKRDELLNQCFMRIDNMDLDELKSYLKFYIIKRSEQYLKEELSKGDL